MVSRGYVFALDSATNSILVNDLSNTIDLESTLIRAEALFRRFERTVEAIDRKSTFPTPNSVRHRRPGPGSPQGSSDSTNSVPVTISGRTGGEPSTPPPAASGTDRRPSVSPGRTQPTSPNVISFDEVETKVITPELRRLLCRTPPKLEKGEVKQHGGGVSS